MLRRQIASLAGTASAGAVIAAGALALSTAPAYACSCVAPSSHPTHPPTDVSVFTGTVTQIDDPQGAGAVVSSARLVVVHFHVDTEYQASGARAQTVTTAASDVSCGYPFVVGQRYTVFAGAMSNVSGCGGAIAGAIDPRQYGFTPGLVPPVAPTGAEGPTVLALVVLSVGLTMIVSLVVLWTVRHHALRTGMDG